MQLPQCPGELDSLDIKTLWVFFSYHLPTSNTTAKSNGFVELDSPL